MDYISSFLHTVNVSNQKTQQSKAQSTPSGLAPVKQTPLEIKPPVGTPVVKDLNKEVAAKKAAAPKPVTPAKPSLSLNLSTQKSQSTPATVSKDYKDTKAIVKSVPGKYVESAKGAVQLGKDILQTPGRAAVSTGLDIAAKGLQTTTGIIPDKNQFVPETKIQKAIFGDKPVVGMGTTIVDWQDKTKKYLESKTGLNLSVYDDFWTAHFVQLFKDDNILPQKFKIGDILTVVANKINYYMCKKGDEVWAFDFDMLTKVVGKEEDPDSFETQIKQVTTHLLQKPITSLEAINTYRITRLSAVIHELRKNNTITSVWENNGKIGKEKKRWTKYTLIK